MLRYGPGGKYSRAEMERYTSGPQAGPQSLAWPGGRGFHPPLGHGAFLCIRFPVHSAEVAAQTSVLAGRYVGGYRGHFVGIARKIHALSSGPRRPEALLMYLFESDATAERFFVSDNRFKQPDFPDPSGTCEAWSMVKYRDTEMAEFSGHQTFMLCITKLRAGVDPMQYRQEVAQVLGDLVERYGGMAFVVQNVGVTSLRKAFFGPHAMVTLHLFQSEADCGAMMDDPRYADMKNLQQAMAEDETAVFSVDSQACP